MSSPFWCNARGESIYAIQSYGGDNTPAMEPAYVTMTENIPQPLRSCCRAMFFPIWLMKCLFTIAFHLPLIFLFWFLESNCCCFVSPPKRDNEKFKKAVELFVKDHPPLDPEPIVKVMIQKLDDAVKKHKKDIPGLQFRHKLTEEGETWGIYRPKNPASNV